MTNRVEITGNMATAPEIKDLASGTVIARLLVTVRVEFPRRRVDVIPVTIWNPTANVEMIAKGDRVSVVGSIQRRYWESPDGRRSRMEVVARDVAWFGANGIETHVYEHAADDVAEEKGQKYHYRVKPGITDEP